MVLKRLLVIGLATPLLATIGWGINGIFPSITSAQDPPAKTFQPGYWQPVGRFNPKQPVKIRLVNETGLPLDYDITNLESYDPDVVGVGKTRLIENFGDEAYIMVYPQGGDSTNPNNPLVLQFSIQVDPRTDEIPPDNIATITVKEAKSDVQAGFYGHRTINVQKTGAFYFYWTGKELTFQVPQRLLIGRYDAMGIQKFCLKWPYSHEKVADGFGSTRHFFENWWDFRTNCIKSIFLNLWSSSQI